MNPNIRPHGRLSATRISVTDALRFLDQHATTGIPTGGRFAIAITAAGSWPRQAPAVVAVAVAAHNREFGAHFATVTVAYDEPTTRMRRMLLATVWDIARSMGYTALFVAGDHRYPGALETEVHPRSAVRHPRHRRPRKRGHDTKGRRLTQQLVERPYFSRWGTWHAN